MDCFECLNIRKSNGARLGRNVLWNSITNPSGPGDFWGGIEI